MAPILLICASLATMAAPHARAPETDDEDEERRAPTTEIEVTGQRLDAARARIEPSLGATTYTLTNDAIENRPGGETRDVGAILVQVPGVRRSGNGGLVVRGTTGGVQYRLNNIILPQGVTDFGERLSARLADQTELITGALPAQYGLASGGVVNITTKNGLHAGGGGQVELYGGSHGTIQPAFEWAGARGGTSLFASGSYRRSDIGIASVDGRRTPVHDSSHEIEGFVFGDHVINDGSRVSLILGSSNEQNQIPALSVLGVSGAERRRGDQSTGNHYAIVSYQRSDARTTIQASLFGLISRETIVPVEPLAFVVDGMSLASRTRRQSIGTQIEGAFDVGMAHTLRAGLVASIDRERQNLRGTTAASLLASTSTDHRTTISGFVQDEWRLTSRLTANGGIRVDRVSNTSDTAHLGPRASLTWSLPSGFSAHAGYARYYVAPPIGAQGQGLGDRLRGETDNYFDIGAEQTLGDLKIGLDGYWRSARNLLAEHRRESAPIGDSFNYRRGKLGGVELFVTYAHGPMTAWTNLAVSRTKARDIISGQSLFTSAQLAYARERGVRLDEDQHLTGSAGLSYRLGRLLLSGDVLFGSGMRRTTNGGTPNDAHLPAYATVDLAVVYHLTLIAGLPLDLRLDMTNLLDRRYALSDGTGLAGGAPQWGERRGIFVGLEQKF